MPNARWIQDALNDKSYVEALAELPLLKTYSEESMLFNRKLISVYFPEAMPLLEGMEEVDLFAPSRTDSRPFRRLEEWMAVLDLNVKPSTLHLPLMQETI